MAKYLGDYKEDDALFFFWDSNDRDGASITRGVNGEVRVYKDDGVGQSTAGVTDTEDFDGLTGVHHVKIDLSADAFYAKAADYTVVLQGSTIDTEVVNAVLATFSIENRASILGIGDMKTTLTAIQATLTGIEGSGFATTDHSLVALRNFFVVEGLAQTISSYDRATSIGRMLQCIRQVLDEPAENVKYTDQQLLSYARSAWSTVIQDLFNVADNPIVLRFDITVSSAAQEYVLPPIVGEILELAKIDSDTDLYLWEEVPSSRWNPAGPGFIIEGNVIRFSPKWQETHTLRLTFIPTGDMTVHTGDTTTFTATTVTMDDSPTTGALDLRENGYAGAILRILSATWGGGEKQHVQERVVSSYDATTRVATVSPAFNPVPSAGTLTYEIVPMLYNLLEMTVCFYTASMLLAIEGPARKQAAVEKKYAEMLRALRLRVANIENRIGDRFQHDTPQNRNYGPWNLGFWS